MTEEVLSQYLPKFNDQLIKQILREGQEQTFVAQIQDKKEVIHLSELKMRHTFDKQNISVLDQIRKKLKLNRQETTLNSIDNISGISVQTDAKYNSKFFLENSFYLNKSVELIKQKLIQEENERIIAKRQKQLQFKRTLNIWFEKSQEQKNEELQKQPQQSVKKGQIPPYQLIIQPNDIDGLQISGIITTKMGYKMNYPTLGYVLKETDIPDCGPNQFVRKIRPLNPIDLDQFEDLSRYVWKNKQYIQFFKVLLKVAQGNLEISETLVKTQLRMKTGFYHVMTFYHISNRSWNICRLIKDLNKKGLYPREKTNLYDTMIQNISEDLDEIFQPLLNKDDCVQIEEQFISFDQYKKRLQEVIFLRESNQ